MLQVFPLMFIHHNSSSSSFKIFCTLWKNKTHIKKSKKKNEKSIKFQKMIKKKKKRRDLHHCRIKLKQKISARRTPARILRTWLNIFTMEIHTCNSKYLLFILIFTLFYFSILLLFPSVKFYEQFGKCSKTQKHKKKRKK